MVFDLLGYLHSESKDAGKKKQVLFGKRVLEIRVIRNILVAVYNKIFG